MDAHMSDEACATGIRFGMAMMVQDQSPDGEDLDLWRALFSNEEQNRKFTLFSDILERLPPATNSQQALGRFMVEVIHGFVRCVTPGKRPPVSLSFAEALLAPWIEAHDKFWQPWKPGRMHQVTWARGVLEAYARLHGVRSLLTELLSIDQVLSEVIQEWPGSSSANAACNARRIWTGASNLVVLSAMPTTLTSQRAVLVERASAFPRPHVAMPLNVALAPVDRGNNKYNHANSQPQLRLLPVYSQEQQQRQDECINSAFALPAEFIQGCLKPFIWADQSTAGFLEEYILWQYSVALDCNDEIERRASSAFWYTSQQQKNIKCRAIGLEKLLVLCPDIRKQPEFIVAAVVKLLVNSRQMSCGNALLYDQLTTALLECLAAGLLSLTTFIQMLSAQKLAMFSHLPFHGLLPHLFVDTLAKTERATSKGTVIKMIQAQLSATDRQRLAELLSTNGNPAGKHGDALLFFYQAHGLAPETDIPMATANSAAATAPRQLAQAWRLMRPPLSDKRRPHNQISNAWRSVVKAVINGISPVDLNGAIRMCFVLASETPYPPSMTALKDLGDIEPDDFQRLTEDATAMLEQILTSLPPSCRITDCPLLLRTLVEVTTEIEHEQAIPFEVPLYRPARAANLFMVILMRLAPAFVSIPAACGLMRMAVHSNKSSLGMGDLHVAQSFAKGLGLWSEMMWQSRSDAALLNTYVSCGVSFTDLIPEALFGCPAWVTMYLEGNGLGCLQPTVFQQLQLKRWRPQMHSRSFAILWPDNDDTGFIDEDEEFRYLHELRCLLFTYRTPQSPEVLTGINAFNHMAAVVKMVGDDPSDQYCAARYVVGDNIKMGFALSSWPEPSEEQLGYMASSLLMMQEEGMLPPGHDLIFFTCDKDRVPWVCPKPATAQTDSSFQPASKAAAPGSTIAKASAVPLASAQSNLKSSSARAARGADVPAGQRKKDTASSRQAGHAGQASSASAASFAGKSSTGRMKAALLAELESLITQASPGAQDTSLVNADCDWESCPLSGRQKNEELHGSPAGNKVCKPLMGFGAGLGSLGGPSNQVHSDADDVLSVAFADIGAPRSMAERENAAKRAEQAAAALLLEDEQNKLAAANAASAKVHTAKKGKGKEAASKRAAGR